MTGNYTNLPDALPAPEDDGAANHLEGLRFPDLELPATGGGTLNPGRLPGQWVIYVYPMTGRPGVALPEGWDRIPGARGCTPQSLGFREQHGELSALDTGVLGLSAQSTAYQEEARERLQLPFRLLSDTSLQLKELLQLPTFTADGMELYRRLTLILREGDIIKVFYPVFPPDRSAEQVLAWLHTRE